MIRRAIVVGVVYGADTRRTIGLMLAAAWRQLASPHEPAPQTLLDEFGSYALVFRLLYWMRLGGERSGPSAYSDFRLEVESARREAGITMAYPQRDVCLDTATQIRGERSRSRAASVSHDAPERVAAPSPSSVQAASINSARTQGGWAEPPLADSKWAAGRCVAMHPGTKLCALGHEGSAVRVHARSCSKAF